MRLYFFTLEIAAFLHRKFKRRAAFVPQAVGQEASVAALSGDMALVSFAGRQERLLVAEGTRRVDEYLLARYVDRHPEVSLVLAPARRDLEHLHWLFNLFHGRYIRYSEADSRNLLTCRVLLMDTMPVPAYLYRYARVAYIGGGFHGELPAVLPALSYGIPLFFGPCYGNSPAACQAVEEGIGHPVGDYRTLAQANVY